MNIDEKKFFLIVIAFGIIFLTFRTMSKAQTNTSISKEKVVQRISFTKETFVEYTLHRDSTEDYDFYKLNRGSIDTVTAIFFTTNRTGLSLFKSYTIHCFLPDNFIDFNYKKNPALDYRILPTSDIDIDMFCKMQNKIKQRLFKIKKI